MSATIIFECPDCKRQAEVPRTEMDPSSAVKAVLQCNYCDDGDRHSPEFFDVNGKWVADDWTPSTGGAGQ